MRWLEAFAYPFFAIKLTWSGSGGRPGALRRHLAAGLTLYAGLGVTPWSAPTTWSGTHLLLFLGRRGST
jgi:hypothetical protein